MGPAILGVHPPETPPVRCVLFGAPPEPLPRSRRRSDLFVVELCKSVRYQTNRDERPT